MNWKLEKQRCDQIQKLFYVGYDRKRLNSNNM